MTDIDTPNLRPVVADRWQPTRAGLVNVWRYWDETFEFHKGRLLLRGPNGSGKSLALELLLPFLLDANAQPHRLTSAARSRGGLYDRMMAGATTTSRAGFVWVEFRQGERTFTIGARLRASTNTRRADATFFTTSLIVGESLHLLDDLRSPLERKALIDAIGTTGRVSDKGHEHRQAVRQTLYPGFGEDRYDALITALLALRKEKLSQGLGLDKMSEILSHALPALEEHDLAAVAEGFERLDRRKDELAALDAELAVVGRLAAARRNYAKVVTARTAGEVRRAESRRDTVTRRQREAEAELVVVADQIAANDHGVATSEIRLIEVDAEIGAIQGSDAYREGAALADLAAEAERLGRATRTEHDRSERAAAVARRRQDELDAAQVAVERSGDGERQARTDVRDAAARVGADTLVADSATPSQVDGWVSGRRESINQVRLAVRNHGERVADRDRAAARLADADHELELTRTEADTKTDALDVADRAHRRAIDAWAHTASAIGTQRANEALQSAITATATPADFVYAATKDLAELARLVTAEHAVAARDLQAEHEALLGERDQLENERRGHEQSQVVTPAAPEWRTDRAGRPGAPLWSLVEVRQGVSETEVNGIETALRASGLLDAWVRPDGQLGLPHGVADLVLGVRGGDRQPTQSVPTRSLGEFLEPTAGPDAVRAAVRQVVSLIPTVGSVAAPTSGEPEVVIGLDGSFRLGPGQGQGLVRPAELVGAAARERRRLSRLDELTNEVARVDRALEAWARRRDALAGEQRAVEADFDAVPGGDHVLQCVNDVAIAEALVSDGQQRRGRAQVMVNEAEESVRAALRTLTVLASQTGLPASEPELAQLEIKLERLVGATTTWRLRIERVGQVAERLVGATNEAEEASLLAAEAAEHYGGSRDAAAAARARVNALEATVGTKYSDLVERLHGLDRDRLELRERLSALRSEQRTLAESSGRLRSVLDQATAEREEAEEHRLKTHDRFGALGADGLVRECGFDVEDATAAEWDQTVTAVLNEARRIATELADIDDGDENVERATARLQESLHVARSSLGGRVDLDDRLTEHGWWVLIASSGGVLRSTGELQVHMHSQLIAGRNELAHDEEVLFERTLAGSIRQALAHRIRQANALVDDINTQLDAVRTVAGAVGVKLKWAVDDEQPPAVKAARNLLLRDPSTLSEAERGDLHNFVRARVEQARADLGENAPWHERLRETLDYRRWHRFGLQIAHRDWQGLRPATDRLLAGLSTGERSIALHLPMLASIVAHYSGVDDSGGCPRLILLDELFAGVDEANRAQLFGTFTTWDLDAVFTSDHEWCAYPTLDGIAIHFLHPAADDEPVTSSRFVWDGHTRTQRDLESVA